MNTVAIGAHPDDIEIGAGASLAQHQAQGDKIRFLILTRGGKLSQPSKREKEALRAGEVLGVDDIRFLGYEDTKVPYDHDIIEELESQLNDFGADRVYIHSENDTHQDHRHAALSSVAATRNIDEVLAFESPSTRPSFTPQYYNTLSEASLAQKIESIRSHKTQQEKLYLEAEAMNGLARFRGQQANARYAEAFQVIRIKQSPHRTQALTPDSPE
ncbi:PIG-L deacetylase family protein [Halobaculum limi]|uniref:PIG-L deacetylase family protein n=1 Tax=Halobaculum limi TaxID=3031916 RepID=UPI0024064689|nr:PIG-L deacetylase family protein [Halobaculum sp. YSMS11]